MDVNDHDAIAMTPLFRGLTPQMSRALVGKSLPRSYDKGAILFHQGEPASAFFIILEGWVKIYRTTPDGLEVVLHVFKRGESFAEQIKVRSAPQRIADFLIRITPTQEGAAVVELPFEKGLLANRLGMKPESFSRALGRLRAYGVAVEREVMRIDDVGRLRRLVEYVDEDGHD